jgi:Flp pilus assembly protein TadD
LVIPLIHDLLVRVSAGKSKSVLWLWLALAFTALVYLPSLRFGFAADDIPQILHNPLVQSWRYAPGYFTQHLWAQVAGAPPGNFYRPLFSLWLLINWKLFGASPAPWHATTLLLHLAATWLVWLVVRELTRRDAVAAVAALVFGLHPVHIETVCWISGSVDSLLAIFFLGSFLAYCRWRRAASAGERAALLATSLVCFALSLLAKEPAIMLPFVLLTAELLLGADASSTERRPLAGKAAVSTPVLPFALSLTRVAPFVLLVAVYIMMRLGALHGFAHPLTGVPPGVQALTWPSLLVFYLRHLLWPAGISEFYTTPYVVTPSWNDFLVPLLVLLVVVALVIFWWRRSGQPLVLFGAAWLLLPLIPALKIDTYQFGELAHDRYLYLPSVGFALLAALALNRLQRGREVAGVPATAAAAAALLSVAYAAATATQSVQWTNNLTLFARGAAIAPNNVHAVASLGRELVARAQYADALPVLERAARLAPNDMTGWFLLADGYYRLGRYPEAALNFGRAAALDPHAAAPRFFLGKSLLALSRAAEAEAPLRDAINLLPRAPGLHQALAEALVKQNKREEARRELVAELALDPQNEAVRQQLASLDAR